MTRYVIIGAGAVGITLAAELQAAGRDVVVVGRGRQLELLRDGAVRYLTPDGSRLLSVAAAGHPGEVRLVPRDILVLATKTQDTEGALQAFQFHFGGVFHVQVSRDLVTLSLNAHFTSPRIWSTFNFITQALHLYAWNV